MQNGGDGGGVDAAGHGDGDEAGLRFRADRKSVELCFGLHCFYFIGFGVVAQEIGINTEFSETTEHTEKAKKKPLNAETRRPQRRIRKDE